jgi:hypothetical protein
VSSVTLLTVSLSLSLPLPFSLLLAYLSDSRHRYFEFFENLFVVELDVISAVLPKMEINDVEESVSQSVIESVIDRQTIMCVYL